MNNRIMRMCKAPKGVRDLPISAQGLPAVFFIRRLYGGLEGLPAVCLEGLSTVFMTGCFR